MCSQSSPVKDLLSRTEMQVSGCEDLKSQCTFVLQVCSWTANQLIFDLVFSHTSTQKNPADLVVSFIHFLQVVRTRTQFILSIPPLDTGLLLVSILTCLTQCVYRWIVLWHRRSWSCTSVENRLQACGKGVQVLTRPCVVFTDFIFTCAAPSKSGKLL